MVNSSRFRILIGPVFFLVLVYWTGHALGKTKESAGDWSYDCEAQECVLQQVGHDTSGQRVLVKVTVVKRAKGLFALVVSPLGIALPSGLGLQVDDGAAEQASFASCTMEGCFAALPMDGSRLAAWQAGLVLNITYTDGAGARIENSLSLLGFTEGVRKLSQR